MRAEEASKRILKEFEQYGLMSGGRPTSAAYALAKLIESRPAPLP